MGDCTFTVTDLLYAEERHHHGGPLGALAHVRALAEEDASYLGMELVTDTCPAATTFLARADTGELVPLWRLSHVPEELAPGGLMRLAGKGIAA